MKEYLKIFTDEDYPEFIDKYLNTRSLSRLKYITQFCGCDYTRLYNPRFLYTRFDHSLVVAHMTWHFTKDKLSTIAALLHDVGTPCFAHCIDYVFGDYTEQESSEKDILEMIKEDTDLLDCLRKDNIDLESLKDLANYPILENKSPRLCADRLDGVLHTCYIWLQDYTLEDIKEVYNNITVLINEDGMPELGFNDMKICEKFVQMVFKYAKEFQSNTDKYVMKYISEMVSIAVEKNLITLEDLYVLKESDIVAILEFNFSSWEKFASASKLICTDEKPEHFHISFKTKKRNVIPLLRQNDITDRIDSLSLDASKFYETLDEYTDSPYAYVEEIDELI